MSKVRKIIEVVLAFLGAILAAVKVAEMDERLPGYDNQGIGGDDDPMF